jgi:hypothetical protein
MRAIRAGLAVGMALISIPYSHATISIYLPADRLAASAPLVVEGTVTRTATGRDPLSGALSTYVTLDVAYVHRGPGDLDRVVLREPGGRFGDLVNVIDAVPVFEPGERVLVFLEPAADGALRVFGMFFGKFALADPPSGAGRVARRELSGRGLIPGRSAAEVEEIPAAHLESLVASIPYEGPVTPRARRPVVAETTGKGLALPRAKGWTSEPLETGRLEWDDVRLAPTGTARPTGAALASDTGGDATPQFTPLSSSYPARWNEADTSTPVTIQIQPTGNPLNDGVAAANEIKRAMAAWTQVPESRLTLQAGSESYDFTGTIAESPAAAFPPVNIVLFNDPYGEITDPSGCSGVLAVGGYWRSGSGGRTVNGMTFYPILRQYVVFNNNFQCFLGIPDNLAEVATHELGHGLGFGHSTVADAIMRSSAYGNGRGPRLGNDDRDGAHCFYPHTLALTSPNGGESWLAGSAHGVTWSATSESGPDAGTVDIEHSTDSGGTWSVVRAGESNDGSWSWTVPGAPGSGNVVRVVRHNRVSPTPSPFPEACSADPSNAVFTILAAQAGTAPDGSAGEPLRVQKAAGGAVTLTWGASCSAAASGYAIYEGTIGALRGGSWDHAPRTCAAGADLFETFTPGGGNVYFLVAPLAGSSEGRLGATSAGADRPSSPSACAPREASSCS